MPKFVTRMPYLGFLGGWNLKKPILIFEISALRQKFLTRAVNFGLESAFSKDFESAFSESLGPGPGFF